MNDLSETASSSSNNEIKEYNYWGAGENEPPPHLLTKNQLGERKLRPSSNQSPAGYIWLKRRRVHIWLYNVNDAVPVRELTGATREKVRLTQRTCRECGFVAEEAGATWLLDLVTMCEGGKQKRVRLCWDCQEKRRRQPLVAQAREWLAEPTRLTIIDTETTGLEWPYYIIQIAVIDGTGAVLLDTLVQLPATTGLVSDSDSMRGSGSGNPARVVIEEGATAVHGLCESDLAGAPSWAEVWPRLREVCRGKILLTYNLEYDWEAIQNSCRASGIEQPRLVREAHCLMELYSEYVGEVRQVYVQQGRRWEWDTSYKWQRLPGGDHTALGDCRAVLQILRQMTATSDVSSSG